MKKCFKNNIFLVISLFIISGCNSNTLNNNQKVDIVKVVAEAMGTAVYIDPSIYNSDDKIVSVIIEFKTSPAVVAVKEAEAKGIHLTLEEATRQVEESHKKFQEELKTLLDANHIPYKIRHTYKTALNGVSMELPTNEVNRLLKSTVISKIYLNREIHLFPQINPTNQM